MSSARVQRQAKEIKIAALQDEIQRLRDELAIEEAAETRERERVARLEAATTLQEQMVYENNHERFTRIQAADSERKKATFLAKMQQPIEFARFMESIRGINAAETERILLSETDKSNLPTCIISVQTIPLIG